MVPDWERIRQEVLTEAARAVTDAKRRDEFLGVRSEAYRIYEMFPDCPLSQMEISEELLRLGVANQLSIKFTD